MLPLFVKVALATLTFWLLDSVPFFFLLSSVFLPLAARFGALSRGGAQARQAGDESEISHVPCQRQLHPHRAAPG